MSLTIVIARNVADRFHGFLGSVMLEVGVGVYVSPRMSKAVRERVLGVLSDWYAHLREGSIVAVWRDTQQPGGLAFAHFGESPREIVDLEGFLAVRRSNL